MISLFCIVIYDNYWNTRLLNLKIIKILKDYNYAIKNKIKLNIKGYKKIRKTKYFTKIVLLELEYHFDIFLSREISKIFLGIFGSFSKKNY